MQIKEKHNEKEWFYYFGSPLIEVFGLTQNLTNQDQMITLEHLKENSKNKSYRGMLS